MSNADADVDAHVDADLDADEDADADADAVVTAIAVPVLTYGRAKKENGKITNIGKFCGLYMFSYT